MIDKLLGFFGYKKENASLRDKDGWFVEWALGGSSTASGIKVHNDSAMKLSTVFACVNAISQDIAKVPFHVYQKQGETKKPLSTHRLHYLLNYQPNEDMSALSFREALTAHALSWGNGYAEIRRDLNDEVVGLYPLRPDRVVPFRDKKTKKLAYEITSDDGQKVNLWASEVLPVHGLGYDGVTGYNVIQYAREGIGAAMAAEKFGAAFFGNGCHFGGNLEHPSNLSEQAQTRLKRQIEKDYQGADKAHRLLILEEGMKFTANSIPPEDAQFLETRQFSVPDICRWFRIPPHKVADLSRATFSNIEQQSIEYVSDCLLAWFRRWEQSAFVKLLSVEEKQSGVYCEHVIEGLLRGDIQARYTAYQTALQNGFMNINEVRARENLNPVEGGDKHFVQLNMTTLDKAGEEQIVENTADRIASAEIKELDKHIKYANTKEFTEWMDTFYAKHDKYVMKSIEPLHLNLEANDITMKLKLKDSDDVKTLYESLKPNHKKRIESLLRGVLCLT